MIKIISWNINGIRSMVKKKDLFNLIKDEKPDIICFGETKISCPFIDVETTLKNKIDGYSYRYWSPCLTRGGYSGTAIFSKKKPINNYIGLLDKKYQDNGIDEEGRVITLEFKNYFLVHVYTPNSGQELKRLDFRVNIWDKEFRKYIKRLNKKKPTIICGDLNVAHHPIDLANPKTNKKNSGFTIEERESFTKLLKRTNSIDTFRYFHDDTVKYSFWTYMFGARKKNKGWRIDYFLVNKKLLKKVKKSDILTKVMGSDHAPVILEIKL
jgi:exodeoxyribonuclease III